MVINKVLYWKGVISRAKGHRVSTLVLWHHAKKGGLNHNMMAIHLPMEDLQDELKKAYCQYHQGKKDPNSCNTWIVQLIEAQATATGHTKTLCGNKSKAENVSN